MATLTPKTWYLSPRTDGRLYSADFWAYSLSLSEVATGVRLNYSAVVHPSWDHFRIYRSTDGVNFTSQATTSVTTYTDTGVVAGTTYYYRVAWEDVDNNSRDEPWTRVGESARFITFEGTTDPIAVGIFVDGVAGNDAWDGTSATFVSGTTGPKRTITAGITACSQGQNLYLLNNQSYAYGRYDLDWNFQAPSGQLCELSGCYVSGGTAFRWTPDSGEARPVFNGEFRSTNSNFAIRGIQFNNAGFVLQATNVNNFTLQYLEVNRSGADTSDCIWFNGTAGSKGIRVLDSTFNWSLTGLNWAGGNDMIAINTYYKYIEVARCTFNRAPHDCLSIASGPHYVHHNTFSNVDAAEDEGYRCCSFNAERDPTGSADGGAPYGYGLVEHNTFLSSNAPSASPPENIAQTIKMQQKGTIYRFNSFDLRTSGAFTQNEVWQLQTCCENEPEKAPLVADQRIYNNYVTAESCRRWAGRMRTYSTDGTNTTSTYNPRTEHHDNWIFNNHFEGTITDLNESMFEFQGISAEFQVGNQISQNKVEYNSFSDSKSDEFLEDSLNGQQTLAQAETNWSAYVNNNTVSVAGGATYGRDLATTVNSGTSNVLQISDAGTFQSRIYDVDAGEIYAGDVITVNGQTATVLDRDMTSSPNTLTLDTSVTWTGGQPVNLDGYAAGYTGIPPSSGGFTGATIAVDATGSGTRYDIGGGNNYGTELSDVPWQSLQPGDAVNIYHRATPYRSLVLVSEQGTAANRIIINGVTDSSGNRPIIDGDGATVVNPSNWDSDFFGTLMMLHRDTVGGTYGQTAEYVTIQNLEFRNATSAYQYNAGAGLVAYDPAARAIWSHGAQYINIYGCIFRNSGCGVFVQAPAEKISKTFHIADCLFSGNGNGNRDHQVYFQAVNDPGVNKNIVEGCVFDDPRTSVVSVAQLKIRGTGTVVRYNWFTSSQRTIDLVEAQDSIPGYMYDNWTAQQIIDEYDTSYIYGNAFVNDIDDSAIPGQLLHVGMDTLDDGDGGLFQTAGSEFGQNAQRGLNGGATYFFHNTVYINSYYPGVYRNSLFDLDSNNESTGSYSAGKLVAINNVIEFDGGGTTRYATGERTGDINWDGANIVNYSEIHNNVLYESDAYADAENTGDDPNITITVNGNILSGTASLVDPTNATLLSKDLALGSGSAAIGQATILPSALSGHPVTKSPASPTIGGVITRVSTDDLGAYESGNSTVYDNFNGSTQALNSSSWNTINAVSSAVLEVQQTGGRYNAELFSDPAGVTTWFNSDEGRLDYVNLAGDFEVICRNIGIDSGGVSTEYQFCGLIVRLSSGNYEFAVVGNRGGTGNTLEYKITSGFSSTQNDIGNNAFPTGKADLRVVRSGSDVDFYYAQPGTNSWTLAPHDSLFETRINFGTGQVQVGIVTYGFSFPDPFVATCDQVEIPTGTPS